MMKRTIPQEEVIHYTKIDFQDEESKKLVEEYISLCDKKAELELQLKKVVRNQPEMRLLSSLNGFKSVNSPQFTFVAGRSNAFSITVKFKRTIIVELPDRLFGHTRLEPSLLASVLKSDILTREEKRRLLKEKGDLPEGVFEEAQPEVKEES